VTTTVVGSAQQSADHPRSRRRIAIGIGVGVALVAIVAALGFWRYAATYAPLENAGWAGPYHVTGQPDVARHSTDLGDELYLRGPVGTEAQWITGIWNNGSHAVTIDSYLNNGLVTRVQWTPYVLQPGGDVTGRRLPPRSLPAEIGPHQTIRVLITVRKPAGCSNGVYVNTDSVRFNWHALGVHHDYDMGFDGTPDEATFVGCPHVGG
jgi:hypothetical protein